MVVVNDLFGDRVVEQSIQRKVAACCVFFVGTELVVAKYASMLIGFLLFGRWRPEGRGFDDFRAENDVYQLKAFADDAGAAKQRANLAWGCVGGDVEVFGLKTNDQVAYCATDNEGVVAGLMQYFAHFDGVSGNIAAVDAVFVFLEALGAPLR